MIKGTVILIHGYLSTSKTWEETDKFFSALGFRVLKPELSPITKSINPNPWIGSEEVEDYLNRYYKLIVPPIFLIGHSMGGLVAKAFLLKYHQKWEINGVVTIATPHLGVNWVKFLDKMNPGIITFISKESGLPILAVIKVIQWASKYFYPNSEILKKLNKAFEFKIPFFLVGAKKINIDGDGIVGLWSQLPDEYIRRPNVSSFLLKGTDHFKIHKEPQVRLRILNFL